MGIFTYPTKRYISKTQLVKLWGFPNISYYVQRGVKVTWGEYIKQCARGFIQCETQTEYNNLIASIDRELEREPPPISKEWFWAQVRELYYTLPRQVTDESIAGTALGNLIKTVQTMLEERAGIKK